MHSDHNGTDVHPMLLPGNGAWHEFVTGRTEVHLRDAAQALEVIKDGAERRTEDVLELWNDADIALRGADSLAGLLSEVHPDPEIRTLAEELAQEIARVLIDRGLDHDLYDVLAGTESEGLDEPATRLREHVLRDFRRTGIDRPDQARARLREISDRLTVLDQDFSRNIRDDVRSIKVTPERLEGLPDDYVATHPPDADGQVTITTDYPDLNPFRTFAHDSAARRALTVEFLNRAWPVNDAVLGEMLELRQEQADLLGYQDWVDYDTEVKMVGRADAIADFLHRVSVAAHDAGLRDYRVLLARRRRDDPDAASLDRADAGYYSELVRREDYSVDAQETRRYFDFGRVRAGLLDVTARLFGVEYLPVRDAPTWHEDVTVYDVVAQGVPRGRIYLDLHPREGKFKHAAQFDLAAGVAGRQLPEGALVCNLPRGFMEHGDVVTLFHEFGHLVHHVLGGQQRWVRFSGVATEWDFVEAPSQMLEEWAWDADVLRTFALDAAGEPIPRELVDRMRAANDFGKGLFVGTQLFYTAVSYLLHRERTNDITATVRDLQLKYDLFEPIDGTHFHAAFGHLSGYTSAYYTYLWSLVISKDIFSAFDPANLFDPVVARRYRDEVLARGGTADAAELVQNFLGRPFDFEAFRAWLDRVPVAVS